MLTLACFSVSLPICSAPRDNFLDALRTQPVNVSEGLLVSLVFAFANSSAISESDELELEVKNSFFKFFPQYLFSSFINNSFIIQS